MSENPDDFKIWFPYEVFYIESMLTITRTAMADQLIVRTIMEDIKNGKEFDKNVLIDVVQNTVTHAASISRYFWPVRTDKIHKKRGQRLREALQISESNPIKNRDVRNFIEHFDENLDNYLQNGISGQVIPLYVGPRPHGDNAPRHFFRAFFIDDWSFHALGQEFKIVEIINELIRINELLETFNENGGRLPK
jgi:hypothetical protein